MAYSIERLAEVKDNTSCYTKRHPKIKAVLSKSSLNKDVIKQDTLIDKRSLKALP